MCVYDVRECLCVNWTAFGVAVVRWRETSFSSDFSIRWQADTHTAHFQNIKQSKYGYRHFLHLSFTILFCYWNGIQWTHSRTHIREIRYRKFNWTKLNRKTFFICVAFASLSLFFQTHNSHGFRFGQILLTRWQRERSPNSAWDRFDGNKWNILKRKKFTIQSAKRFSHVWRFRLILKLGLDLTSISNQTNRNGKFTTKNWLFLPKKTIWKLQQLETG